MKNIWRLLAFIPHYRRRFTLVVLANAVLGLLDVAAPYIFKLIVDQIARLATHPGALTAASHTVSLYLGLLIGVQVLSIGFNYIQERLTDTLYNDTRTSLRLAVYRNVSQLSIDFFERTRIGEITQRAGAGVMDLSSWIDSLADNVLLSVLRCLFIVVILALKSPILGIIAGLAIPAMLVTSATKMRRSKPLRRESRRLVEVSFGRMTEAFTHMATIRSLGMTRATEERFATSTEESRQVQNQAYHIDWNFNLIRDGLFAAVVLSCFAITALGAVHGNFTAGDVFLVLLYTQEFMSSLMPLGRVLQQTGDVETSCERIVELLNERPTVVDRPNAIALERLESIEFDRVSFRYPGKDRQILKDVSFTLPVGQTLALVGPSGVGKTTITKLLLRFYEPTSGRILVNGRDIREFTQASIRDHVGMVMQDVALFNDTIGENLRYAKPEADDATIQAAARAAHADIFIDKLADGYDTLVGERGIRLSGGEKQRVAVARAILRDPQLIVLDEATSALDSESERLVQTGLEQLMRGRTAIVIAHRLSTVRRADQILVLQQGRVIEQGTHVELADQTGGLYAKLFKLQTEGALTD